MAFLVCASVDDDVVIRGREGERGKEREREQNFVLHFI